MSTKMILTKLVTVDWCLSSNHDCWCHDMRLEIREMMTFADDDTEDSEIVDETSETEMMSSCWSDPEPAADT